MSRDRGSASIWVLAAAALVLAITMVAVVRAQAVLARHRAESAADLAALAAAGQIGVGAQICPAAEHIASVNGAQLEACTVRLSGGGRSGSVSVRVGVRVNLPIVGDRSASASARAGRLPAPPSRNRD